MIKRNSKILKSCILVQLFIVYSLALCSNEKNGKQIELTQGIISGNLKHCLYEIGQQVDVKFYVETGYSNENHISDITSCSYDSNKVKSTNLWVFFDNLVFDGSRSISTLFPQNNLDQIYLVDSLIKDRKNYVLDEIIEVFKFKGTPVEMLKQLNKQFPKLHHQSWFAGSAIHTGNDMSTFICVDVKKVTLRELLTISVSGIDDYESLQWEANTLIDTMDTYVCFNGTKLIPTPVPKITQAPSRWINHEWRAKNRHLEETPTPFPEVFPTATPWSQ